jgi:hypothetical protein
MAYRSHLRPHSLPKQNRKMPKPAETNDSDLLSRSTAMADHGGVNGETGAEHRGDDRTWDRIGDGKDELFVDSDVGCVTSPCFVPVGVIGVVCVDLLGTVILVPSFTLPPC